MKLSLRTQAVLGIGLIEILMLIVLLYSVFHFISRSTTAEVERRAQSIARVFAATAADDVLSLDLGSLQSFVDAAAATPGTAFARVIDYDGRLLAQAGDADALLQPFAVAGDSTVLPDLYMAAAAIEKAGLNYGTVEVGLDLRGQNAAINALRTKSLLIAAVEVLLAALFSIAAGYYLVRRLHLMKVVVERANAGDYSAKIHDRVTDEVAELAQEIDRLTERMRWEHESRVQRVQELEALNQLLQRKIAELRDRS